MQGMLYPIADLLTRTPTGRQHTVHGQKWDEYAGPSFEYHPFGTGHYATMNRGPNSPPSAPAPPATSPNSAATTASSAGSRCPPPSCRRDAAV